MKKLILTLFLLLVASSYAAPNFVNSKRAEEREYKIVQDVEGIISIQKVDNESATTISYWYGTKDPDAAELNKILKEYGDIIAEADNMPDLTKYDVVNIKQFNDLVDIEEELHSPIICNEIREDLESWFLIFHNETAYRFILKYEDFNHLRR